MAKKQSENSGKSKLQETLDALNKKYGEGSVLEFGSKSTGEYETISTGSIGFDYYTLGIGGFVKGKLYELIGWEGSGKSTICGHAVAECQKKNGKVVYKVDFDETYEVKTYMSKDDMKIYKMFKEEIESK